MTENGGLNYVFYLLNFYRKYVFGLVLGVPMNGYVQVGVFLLVNILQLLMIVYIVGNSLYLGRFKIMTRIINLVCVIVLECLILVYNVYDREINRMILIGVACTYLAMVVTGIGII